MTVQQGMQNAAAIPATLNSLIPWIGAMLDTGVSAAGAEAATNRLLELTCSHALKPMVPALVDLVAAGVTIAPTPAPSGVA